MTNMYISLRSVVAKPEIFINLGWRDYSPPPWFKIWGGAPPLPPLTRRLWIS